MKQLNGQMSLFDPDTPCGKTSPAHTAATRAKTSERCSKNSAASKTVTPMYLDLRTGSGLTRERSWQTGIPSLGEHSTPNFGESPSVVVESTLSQILEANVPLKYYLSARACVGVLNRAQKRGKPLPEILKTALEQQIKCWRKYGSPLPVFYEQTKVCIIYDEENITSKTNASNPQIGSPCHTLGRTGAGRTLLCQCYTVDYVGNSSGNDVSGTIDAHYYLGCGARGGKEREFVAIALDRSAYNQGKNAKYDIGVDTGSIAFTVTAKGPGAVCCGTSPDNSSTCGNVGCDEDLSPTLQVKKRAAVIYGETQYVVRRLTPLECCRLQGMPDWWENDVYGADSARYKMWGNGMALPNALYVMEGFYE